MGIDVRIANKGDLPEIQDFLAATNGGKDAALAIEYVSLAKMDISRKPTFIIARQSGELIGTACFTEEFFTTDFWGISWVNIIEKYRNQGIATQMIKIILENIQKKLAGKPATVILANYPDKTKLYQNCEFKTIGTDHENGNVMIKMLNV